MRFFQHRYWGDLGRRWDDLGRAWCDLGRLGVTWGGFGSLVSSAEALQHRSTSCDCEKLSSFPIFPDFQSSEDFFTTQRTRAKTMG